MKVIKFGGTSVGSADAIRSVYSIVSKELASQPVLVVVSAMGGTTDQLIRMGQMAEMRTGSYQSEWESLANRHIETLKSIASTGHHSPDEQALKQYLEEILNLCRGVDQLQECSPRTLDRLVSFGELMSSLLVCACFRSHNMKAVMVDSRSLVKTNSNFGQATVDLEKSYYNIKEYFKQNRGYPAVLPGFIASNSANQTTTLGRGGSDYTAALLASALQASQLEIWTDVSGMYTADPRKVPSARIIPEISYREAMELCHFGAKVIYPPTLQPVMNRGIPVWVKNTFKPEERGTLIQTNPVQEGQLRGLSGLDGIALLSLEGSGMIGIPGFSQRLFGALAKAQINVVLITQASSEHSICVGISENSAELAHSITENEFVYEIERRQLDTPQIETGLAVIALVGEGMRSHTGISGRMFGALGRNGINVRAITQGASERNISAVVTQNDINKALQVMHEEFFGRTAKTIHLFLMGTGQVGKHLLAQIAIQEKSLEEYHRIRVEINGLCNRRQMIISEAGIEAEIWEEKLSKGAPADIQKFARAVADLNLPNSVFVDAASGPETTLVYEHMLIRSVSVVACNKEAASGPLQQYKNLKSRALEFNTRFLYETNVGAGLPVIGTLSDLVRSGDRIHRILAVLSGTLNFVFNEYKAQESFASVVRRAKEMGYTEPDPRLDLTGYDVQRKLLILAREAGCPAELSEFKAKPFLPDSCLEGGVDDFFREMELHEAHFARLFREASVNNSKLRYVAEWTLLEEKPYFSTSLGLQQISEGHDLFHLYGKDNAVIVYTDRYRDQPLVIKGAGAGAEVTAAGVFGDIISAVQS
jgi:aspartokinase/homoserine dehydrogenase 1